VDWYNRQRVPTFANPYKLYAICFLLLAVLFALLGMQNQPSRAELTSVEGLITRVTPSTTSGKAEVPTRFGIVGDPRWFQYLSTAGDSARVERELFQAHEQPVRLLVDSNDRFSTVFEVVIGGRVIRSYEEVDEAWRSNQRYSIWLTCIFSGLGLFALPKAVRSSRGR
jgi:hypothetical protein